MVDMLKKHFKTVKTLESMKHNRIIYNIESVLLCDPVAGAARGDDETGRWTWYGHEKGWRRWWFASKAIKWFDALIEIKIDMVRK